MVYTTHTADHIQSVWPPDDTEESVAGTDRHQLAILTIRFGINELAAAGAAHGQRPPWHAGGQTIIAGMERPDGTPYTVLPDVFCYRRGIDPDRTALSLALDGPPVLIIEVASESTVRSDLDLERGKGWTYRHAGVREYLVLDPTERHVPGVGRGWWLQGGIYRPWLPDERGWWQSDEIDIAVTVEERLPRISNRDGWRQLREGEINQALARRDQELARRGEALGREQEARARSDEARRRAAEEAARAREALARAEAELADLRRLLGGRRSDEVG